MPIYEYKCKKGHEFEAMQRMVDDALTECTVCGAVAQRVFSAPAVHFKGSGFYNTDYGKKNVKPSKESGSDNGGSDSSSSSSDSSSKSDSKSDSKKSSDSSSSSSSKSSD